MSHIQEAINMLDRSLTSSNNPMMPKKLAYQVKKLLESATQDDDKGWTRESGYIVFLEQKLSFACDIIDRLEESRTRKDEYWIRREEELGSQLKAKGEALQASLPTSMMMCPKCDINYMKPTEDMCDKCRIEQLEERLKARLKADIASACVIKQLEREVADKQALTPNSPEGQEGEAV